MWLRIRAYLMCCGSPSVAALLWSEIRLSLPWSRLVASIILCLRPSLHLMFLIETSYVELDWLNVHPWSETRLSLPWSRFEPSCVLGIRPSLQPMVPKRDPPFGISPGWTS